MNRKAIDNVKLGLFVLIGLFFLVISLYLIGKNRNIFGSTTAVSASFSNVQGLMAGNNVRFSGINVGTVRKVEILNDSLINVVMSIQNNARQYIRKNAIASVGTDGLMGNKLININPVAGNAAMIDEGDILKTKDALETDLMIRTLEQTNKNLEAITYDIMRITQNVINSNGIWNLTTDQEVAENMKNSIANIRVSTEYSIDFLENLTQALDDMKSGSGLSAYLIGDKEAPLQIAETIEHLNVATKQASQLTKDLEEITQGIKNKEGAVGTILKDSLFAENLSRSMENIEKGTNLFNENMEALKSNFLLRRYFKRQEKKETN
jgi:phospholipid/cholesterol/gamma-HCH transport system substrate-binding protein